MSWAVLACLWQVVGTRTAGALRALHARSGAVARQPELRFFLEDLHLDAGHSQQLRDASQHFGTAEFEADLLNYKPPDPPQMQVFRRFDTDASTTYDKSELAAFLTEFRNTSLENLDQLWEGADRDGDGALDYDEFIDCVVNPASCFVDSGPSAATAGLFRTDAGDRLDALRAERGAQRRMEALEDLGLVRDEAVRRAVSNRTMLRLRLMPEKGLNSSWGAACLDGSDAGFFLAPAAAPQDARHWLILIQGGGWCASPEDCLERSGTERGSSKYYPEMSYFTGIISDNCTENPTFCNFNRVVVPYCDGTSFTGDRPQPLLVTKHANSSEPAVPLYFRGKRILNAVIATLLAEHGLALAEQVLLTGCSAGGLAALLHADHVRDLLTSAAPMLWKFRVMPLSGFFLNHNNVENAAVFATFMYEMTKLANSVPGLNQKCLAAMPPGKKWRCIFAELSYSYTDAPVFILNSALDWWSSLCILFSSSTPRIVAIKPTGSCGLSNHKMHYTCGGNVEKCTPFEMFAVNQYIRDFSSTLEANSAYGKAGNGAFVHSCHLHCEAVESSHWSRITVQGVTMQQAVLKWWKSDGMPAALHSYKPCEYKQGSPEGSWPYQCNPTCTL